MKPSTGAQRRILLRFGAGSVLVLASAFGITSVRECIHHHTQWSRAIAVLDRIGGRIQGFDSEVVTLWGAPVSSRELAALEDFECLHGTKLVFLSDTNVVDEDLRLLARWTEIEALDLRHTRITGAGLQHLRCRDTLKTLNLSSSHLQEMNLRLLQHFPNIEFLVLRDTRIGDEALTILETCPNIRALCMEGTDVTDAGLQAVSRMKSLRGLDVSGTAVTASALEWLRKARPEITVVTSNTTTREARHQGGPGGRGGEQWESRTRGARNRGVESGDGR